MDITSYPRERIEEGIRKAKEEHQETNDYIRMLFSPTRIDDSNFERACDIYSRIDPENYETIVIIESYDQILDKKLPMPSHKTFKTPLGEVRVNDHMRNEFCDEDDDFFIHDEGFSKNMSLFHQLMMLQCTCDDFSVVSVQIADTEQAIVKELAHVLQEVLAPRQALLVFCCGLDQERKEEFSRVRRMIENENFSGLLNYLNSGESHIEGVTTFIAGLMVAGEWDLDLNFLDGPETGSGGSLLTAYADRQRILL